ncbi:NYN domain-containing protein [Bacillus marinisedimentorum]|uniref:NYN domain-containing protein n=1 Tax=Bacillus marinisedimentorum TaxID=1821260 RepID=UPI000872F0C6|nr:NYN domain-containing protein [Bacillus marinisedimentorum]
MDVLLVDGYNIIGAWDELKRMKENDFAGARDKLVEKMAEYQAYKGMRVMIIFDAHLVPGIEKKHLRHKVEIVYTRENETADERIEKLAKELNDVRTQVHVATSDYTEQWVIFAQGALRISARELISDIKEMENKISKDVETKHRVKAKSKIQLSDEVAEFFEKWRRGER